MAAVSADDSSACAAFPREQASLGEHALLQHSSGSAPSFFNFGLKQQAPAQTVVQKAKEAVVQKAKEQQAPGEESFLAEAGFDATNVQEFLTSCEAITPESKEALATEIKEYEADFRFQAKIKEARGEIAATDGHKSIVKYLRENVLQKDWSVLELGCAAGGMLRYVDDVYVKNNIGSHGSFVGVELVTGWVEFAQEYYPSQDKAIDIYEGDITEFSLPKPYESSTFDFVMLNDVMEHIQKKRYGCFFAQLNKVTHAGSIVYMHTPSPKAQLLDKDQYYENVVPHHLVVSGMAMIGFELVKFEYDMDTLCDTVSDPGLPRQLQGAGCYFNGWPKYTHNVYRKVDNKDVLNVS